MGTTRTGRPRRRHRRLHRPCPLPHSLASHILIPPQGYGEVLLPSHPHTAPLLASFQRGEHWLGPWWEQPGRRIVVGLLDSIPFPPREAGWGEGVRVKFDGQQEELVMRKKVGWAQWEGQSTFR
jgi:hypothetical protein